MPGRDPFSVPAGARSWLSDVLESSPAPAPVPAPAGVVSRLVHSFERGEFAPEESPPPARREAPAQDVHADYRSMIAALDRYIEARDQRRAAAAAAEPAGRTPSPLPSAGSTPPEVRRITGKPPRPRRAASPARPQPAPHQPPPSVSVTPPVPRVGVSPPALYPTAYPAAYLATPQYAQYAQYAAHPTHPSYAHLAPIPSVASVAYGGPCAPLSQLAPLGYEPGWADQPTRKRSSSFDSALEEIRARYGSGESLCWPAAPHCAGGWGGSCGNIAGCKPGLEYDERLQKLESDKSSLQLQVSVLTEQIDAQTEKISELEDQLRTRQMLLGKAEDRLQKDLALQQELLQRSSFETQKLEVMNKMSNLTLQQKTLERENIELRNRLRRAEMANRLPASPSEAERSRIREKPPTVPRGGAFPAATSTPNHSLVDSPQRANSSASTTDGSRYTSALDSPASNNTATYREGSLPKTPPSSHRRRVESLGGTLPRVSSAGPSSAGGGGAHGDGQRRAVAFGKQSSAGRRRIWGRVTGKFSRSEPNLADTDQTSGHGTAEDGVSGPPSPSAQPKNKGFKKLFGRMKRSNSGSLEADIPDGGEFRRGGTRATAGPRLGWSGEKSREDDRLWRPLSEWDTDTVVAWFHEMGLSAYTAEARRWVRSGSHLLRATPAELEKELGLKHPLHRKKVVLALRAAGSSADDPPGHIDHNFVMRWLDDVGLPQYKDAFLEARVDGRVLNQLTLDDLHTLKVTNLLHALSLKRGIQVLRSNGFSPACLRRRSTPDEPRQPAPHEVALWTNHRVMEWLREVDLAEYAPNMRGSGVHGALLVHEPRFTGELMASVLSIPASKSLLRRHLFTRFNELVGADILREKRDVEDNQSIPPLRPDSKVKLHKRGQFTLKRRKGKEQLEAEDFLCPLDTQSSPLPSPEVSTNQRTALSFGPAGHKP
ncbi:liprin-beta-1-like isoform X6 [Amphibalanus amphitrite]|uniref:liprin-beta-1-like isoform X6 n=1 Tax=Amphibalanus amphitrite TaxID=1232801 RepID=UPI001C8FDE3E|nr:liprin-beta-1-like isoform X6 [Amphibalanus amphitrite]